MKTNLKDDFKWADVQKGRRKTMKIQVVGDIKKPVIVMLSGSFCPSACLGYIYGIHI